MLVWRLGENFAPRAYDHGVSIAFASTVVASKLGGRDNVAKIFNGARPEKHLPVTAAGAVRKGGRHKEDMGTLHHESAVQFREPKVVADAKSQLMAPARNRDDLGAWSDIPGFTEGVLGIQVNIEQMHFVVARHDPSVFADHKTGIGNPVFILASKWQATSDDHDLMCARKAAQHADARSCFQVFHYAQFVTLAIKKREILR